MTDDAIKQLIRRFQFTAKQYRNDAYDLIPVTDARAGYLKNKLLVQAEAWDAAAAELANAAGVKLEPLP